MAAGFKGSKIHKRKVFDLFFSRGYATALMVHSLPLDVSVCWPQCQTLESYGQWTQNNFKSLILRWTLHNVA